ncbi:MAG: YciI-like protein [Ignavibacteriaceae bacterium]
MYYILFYQTIDDYTEKRKPYREAHLAYANKAHEEGKLVMAGALTDPADSAVLIFKCDAPSAVENFAMNDPYVKNGLIKEWKVRPWTVVISD